MTVVSEKRFMEPGHLRNLSMAFKEMCEPHISGQAYLEPKEDGYIYYLEAANRISIKITKTNNTYAVIFELAKGVPSIEAKNLDDKDACIILVKFLVIAFCALADLLRSNAFEYCKWLNGLNSKLLALVVVNARQTDTKEIKEVIGKLPKYIHDRVNKIERAS